MRNRIERIEFPVFSNFIVHAEVTEDIEKTMKKYPKIAEMSSVAADPLMDALTAYDGEKICYVFFHSDADVGTISHEAVHAVENMFECFNVDFKGETPAYHIGYIVKRIFNFMRKR
jgi:hypothetical protein